MEAVLDELPERLGEIALQAGRWILRDEEENLG